MLAKFDIDPKLKIKLRDNDAYVEFNDQDRLDNMSYRAYNDPQYWWVILHANDYQIEFDIEAGELLRIPFPLESALNDLGVLNATI